MRQTFLFCLGSARPVGRRLGVRGYRRWCIACCLLGMRMIIRVCIPVKGCIVTIRLQLCARALLRGERSAVRLSRFKVYRARLQRAGMLRCARVRVDHTRRVCRKDALTLRSLVQEVLTDTVGGSCVRPSRSRA